MFRMRFNAILAAFFVILGTVSTVVQAEQFPNFLTSPQDRELYEKVMAHILKRIVSTIDENGQVKQVRIFNYLKTELAKIDPQAQLISQDVRALGGYIDNQVYNFMEDHPGADPKIRLHQMLADHSDLSRMEVLGNASDIDVLMIGYTKEKFTELNNRAKEILNSFEMSLDGSSGLSSNLNRTLNTHADVKDYNEQMERATSQGGSTVDFLSLNLATGQLIEPDNVKGAIDDYIRGHYRYLRTKTGFKIDDIAKQVVRAYRPLTEVPRLSLLEPELLMQQTSDVIAELNKKGISNKALEQFGKMDRNSRMAAGNNRLLKGEKESVEAAFLELLTAVRKKYSNLQTLAEYVPRYPVGRAARELPANLLMSVDQFIQQKTAGTGMMYHGTPNFESSLAMARGGFRVSGGMFKQGIAAYGSGAYFSGSESLARSYGRNEGFIFTANLRQDRPVRILNLDALKKEAADKFLADIGQEFPGQDPHTILAEVYGVDIIIRSHIVVVNSAAVALPRDEIFLIEGIYNRVSQMQPARSKEELKTQLKEYAEYVSLAQVIEARGLAARFPVIYPGELIRSAKTMIESDSSQLIDGDAIRSFNRARQFGFYLGQTSEGIDWAKSLQNNKLQLRNLAVIAEYEMFGNALWGETIRLIKSKTDNIDTKTDYDLLEALKIFELQRIWPPGGFGMVLLERLHKSYVAFGLKYSQTFVFTKVLIHQSEWSNYFYEEFLKSLEVNTDERMSLLQSLNGHTRIPAKVLERILAIINGDEKNLLNWLRSITNKVPIVIWEKAASFVVNGGDPYDLNVFLTAQKEWPDVFWFALLNHYKTKPNFFSSQILTLAAGKRFRLSDDVISGILTLLNSSIDNSYKSGFIKVLASIRIFPNSMFDKALSVLFQMKDVSLRRQYIAMLRGHGWPLMSEHWNHVLKLLESDQGMHHRLVLELLQESKYWPMDVYLRAVEIVKAGKIEPTIKENLAYLLYDRIKRLQTPAGQLEARVDGVVVRIKQSMARIGERTQATAPECEQLLLNLDSPVKKVGKK